MGGFCKKNDLKLDISKIDHRYNQQNKTCESGSVGLSCFFKNGVGKFVVPRAKVADLYNIAKYL